MEFYSFDFVRVERGVHLNHLFNQRFGDTYVALRVTMQKDLFLASKVPVGTIEHWVSVHRDKILEKLAVFFRDFDKA